MVILLAVVDCYHRTVETEKEIRIAELEHQVYKLQIAAEAEKTELLVKLLELKIESQKQDAEQQ